MKRYILIVLLSLFTKTEAQGPATEQTQDLSGTESVDCSYKGRDHYIDQITELFYKVVEAEKLSAEKRRQRDQIWSSLIADREKTNNANFNRAMKTIGVLAVGTLVWILAKKLFSTESIFRNINQTLTAAEEQNAELEALKKELSIAEALSSKDEIVILFNQCNVTKLTAELEITARLATAKMKQEWATLRIAHDTFLDAWESICKILNTSNSDAQLTEALNNVKNTLNKMYHHLNAIIDTYMGKSV